MCRRGGTVGPTRQIRLRAGHPLAVVRRTERSDVGFVAEVYLRGGEGSDGDQRCRRWRASRELRLSESPSTGIILIHSVP